MRHLTKYEPGVKFHAVFLQQSEKLLIEAHLFVMPCLILNVSDGSGEKGSAPGKASPLIPRFSADARVPTCYPAFWLVARRINSFGLNFLTCRLSIWARFIEKHPFEGCSPCSRRTNAPLQRDRFCV